MFLIAAAEHDTPNRARAYLITDQAVAATAALYADYRPLLDQISQRAVQEQDHCSPERSVPFALSAPVPADDGEDAGDEPEIVLWAALVVAPPEGTTVPDLMAETGMSRPWVYLRLPELAEHSPVFQVSRGRWRAVPR